MKTTTLTFYRKENKPVIQLRHKLSYEFAFWINLKHDVKKMFEKKVSLCQLNSIWTQTLFIFLPSPNLVKYEGFWFNCYWLIYWYAFSFCTHLWFLTVTFWIKAFVHKHLVKINIFWIHVFNLLTSDPFRRAGLTLKLKSVMYSLGLSIL